MAPSFKNEFHTYDYETSPSHSVRGTSPTSEDDAYLRGKVRAVRILDSLRIGVTLLALCAGLVGLGLAANGLRVYNSTYLPNDEWFLPLWPSDMDTKPNVVLIVGGAVLSVANAVALFAAKVTKIRNAPRVHTPIMFIAPSLGLLAALVAMAVFYAVNASETQDTILSWSCRWTSVPQTAAPYFGSLCHQGWGAVIVAVIMVPVEFAAVVVSGVQWKVEKHMTEYTATRKGGA